MARIDAVPANVVFRYVALVYSGSIAGARRAARDLGVKKAVYINQDWVELVGIGHTQSTRRKWKHSGIEEALRAYQQERFTHFYHNGRAIGAIICHREQESFLSASIESHIFPEDTERRYL